MNMLDAYRQIVQDTLHEGMSKEDILWLMVVLHTHAIILYPEISIEGIQRVNEGKGISLSPLTRTHLSELFASLWVEGDQRRDKDFWFSLFVGNTPYEVFEDIPENLRDRALSARSNIAKHNFVESLIEE